MKVKAFRIETPVGIGLFSVDLKKFIEWSNCKHLQSLYEGIEHNVKPLDKYFDDFPSYRDYKCAFRNFSQFMDMVQTERALEAIYECGFRVVRVVGEGEYLPDQTIFEPKKSVVTPLSIDKIKKIYTRKLAEMEMKKEYIQLL